MPDNRNRRANQRREKELREEQRRKQAYEIILSVLGLYPSFRILPSLDRNKILRRLIRLRVVLGPSAEARPQATDIAGALTKELRKTQQIELRIQGELREVRLSIEEALGAFNTSWVMHSVMRDVNADFKRSPNRAAVLQYYDSAMKVYEGLALDILRRCSKITW